MAEEVENEAADAEGDEQAKPAKKSRKAVKLFGGLIALVATGSALAMMAIPAKVERPRMAGPFEFKIFELDDEPTLTTNTQDDNFSRYVKFEPITTVFAYDENYPNLRREESGFIVAMRTALSRTTLQYKLDHIFENPDNFNEELRQAAEPILFPVCFGDAIESFLADPESGLMPGDSQETSGTFRGDFHMNKILIDGARGTLQINADGPVQSFNGNERNLMVEDREGKVIFVDVTGVDESFEGSIQLGVKGRIRRLTATFLAQ